MKNSEIFDICHSRYRSLRGHLKEAVGGIQSLALEKPSDGYRWRPDRARACEYVADFERIGRHTLRRPEWKGRLRLFETYFVVGVEYRRAIQLVGVAEGTFDYWFQEVKRTLGAEYSRTGIFPPSAYFQTRNGEAARRRQASLIRAPNGNREDPLSACRSRARRVALFLLQKLSNQWNASCKRR